MTPKMRHLQCPDHECTVCMEDADGLRQWLIKQLIELGAGAAGLDILSWYRKFLNQREILAETPAGWPTAAAYNPKNLTAFLRDWMEDLPAPAEETK